MPSGKEWSLGTVGVIEESGFVKAGTESVGVATQWCGRTGKTQNCQVGVFLAGTVPAGSAILDSQLFLPEERAADAAHLRKTHVPASITFQSKPHIAAELIRRTLAAGKVQFDWITADELYGDSGEFLDALEEMQLPYVVEVRCNTVVWTVDPATLPGAFPGPKRRKKLGSYKYPEVRQVRELAAELPQEAWHPLKLREGSKGPLVYEFAFLRVWAMRHSKAGPPILLLFRRSLEKTELKFYVSNASVETPWQQAAMAGSSRWRVEEALEDGKMHLGMADYETRSWGSWHHHMSLVALALLYVTLTRREMRSDVPELTLDMALRLLRSAFARRQLSEEDAIRLMEYHLERNRQARNSHRKTWLARHNNAFS